MNNETNWIFKLKRQLFADHLPFTNNLPFKPNF